MSKRGNGEGSIYFDNTKNRWKGLIAVGYYDNGRIRRKSVFGKSKTEVKQKIKQIELAIATGDYIDESTVTIYQLAMQMQNDKLNYNEIKPATYYRNLETLKRLTPIYSTPLQKATETQIKDFLIKQQDYSDSTIKKVYQMLKAVFKEAKKRNIIKKDIMEDIRRPRSTKANVEKRALTIEEQSKLINVLVSEDVQYSNEMLISMLTGMRMGEILALKPKDINLNFNTISVNRTISKGKKGEVIESESTKTYAGIRKIPMTEDVRNIFASLLQFNNSKDYIFTTEAGKLLTTNQVNSQFTRTLKKYDILDESVQGAVSLHSLRHTYATRCIEAGMLPKVLQKLLGHTDIKITLNTYCTAFESFQNDNISKVNDYLKNNGLSIGA